MQACKAVLHAATQIRPCRLRGGHFPRRRVGLVLPSHPATHRQWEINQGRRLQGTLESSFFVNYATCP